MTVLASPTATSSHRDSAALVGLTLGLPPVSLAEVDATAALQTRVDRKYLIPTGALTRLVDGLSSRLSVLTIDGRRVFSYQSIYFDTADHGMFRDHTQGRRLRTKVRTRLYADSGLAMLEVKQKGGRGETIKHRIGWSRHHLDQLTGPEDGRGFVDSHLGGRYRAHTLRPSLVSTYRRATFVDLTGGLRITCDVELAFGGPSQSTTVPPNSVLVETKSASGRSPADRLLHRLGHREMSISKYCAGIALTTGLPANRWHRTVHRHLAER